MCQTNNLKPAWLSLRECRDGVESRAPLNTWGSFSYHPACLSGTIAFVTWACWDDSEMHTPVGSTSCCQWSSTKWESWFNGISAGFPFWFLYNSMISLMIGMVTWKQCILNWQVTLCYEELEKQEQLGKLCSKITLRKKNKIIKKKHQIMHLGTARWLFWRKNALRIARASGGSWCR